MDDSCVNMALARWTRTAVSEEVRILAANSEYRLSPVMGAGAPGDATARVPASAGVSIVVAAVTRQIMQFRGIFQVCTCALGFK